MKQLCLFFVLAALPLLVVTSYGLFHSNWLSASQLATKISVAPSTGSQIHGLSPGIDIDIARAHVESIHLEMQGHSSVHFAAESRSTTERNDNSRRTPAATAVVADPTTISVPAIANENTEQSTSAESFAATSVAPVTVVEPVPAKRSTASQREDQIAKFAEPSLESSVSCIPSRHRIDNPFSYNRGRDRSCKFSNLYIDQHGLVLHFVKGSPKGTMNGQADYCVFFMAMGGPMCPKIVWHKDYGSLKDAVMSLVAKVYYRYMKGLTLFVQSTFTNAGHAMFDDLYPEFLALNKFGLENQTYLSYERADGHVVKQPKGISNPKPGSKVYVHIEHSSKMAPDDTAALSSSASLGLIWRSWSSGHSFAWRHAIFVRHLNATHSLIRGSCDHRSIMFSEVQSCVSSDPKALPSKGEVLVLVIPSKWLHNFPPPRDKAPYEQVFANFAAKRKVAEREIWKTYEFLDTVGKPYLLRFETAVAGTGDANQMLTPEVAIGGSHGPYWAMIKFRNRMLDTYGITKRSYANAQNPYVLAVWNKRFATGDSFAVVNGLKIVKQRYSIQGRLLDFATIPFEEQLKVVHGTDIYISGPGTGIMNAPFLPDGAAVWATGAWIKVDGKVIPQVMEQQVVGGGTPYLHVLYRNFSFNTSVAFGKRPRPNAQMIDIVALQKSDVAMGIMQARQRMLNGRVSIWEETADIEDNLSPEAQVFRAYCRQREKRCHQVLRARNFGPCKTFQGQWYEMMAYEVNAPADVCTVDGDIMFAEREKRGMHHYGPGIEQSKRSWEKAEAKYSYV